jgi:hypothetical protein
LLAAVVAGGAHAQTYPSLSETTLDTGSSFVFADAVGDLNHDGLDDVVAVLFRSAGTSPMSIAIYLGRPDGTFSAPVLYPAPDGTGGVAIADMNLDGNLDVVFGAPQTAGVMYGDGAGGLSPAALFFLPTNLGSNPPVGAAASRPASTLPADCLSQGRCGAQAAMAVMGNGSAVVLEWTATADGQLPVSPVMETILNAATVVMNRSGTWVPPSASNGTDLYLGDVDPSFETLFKANAFYPPMPSNGHTGVSVDLNGDGLSDLVTSDFGGDLFVSLQGPQGLGSNSGVPASIFLASGGVNLNLLGAGDLDADGKVDLVGSILPTPSSATGVLAIFRGDGRGGFASQEYYSNAIRSFSNSPVGVGRVGSLGFVAVPRDDRIALVWYTKGGFTVSAGADQTVVAPTGSANFTLVGSVFPDGAATSYCWTLDGATCFSTAKAATLNARSGPPSRPSARSVRRARCSRPASR